ncbi:MAG: UDP-galactopyranose mutase [Syntrophobacterales bacterium]|nr:UDP-galactopyranose mutase [Syntrophobacterales bacterium]
MFFKYIVVGAGLSGSVISERIARVLGEAVLVIEKRGHIGGNCYDERNRHGIILHRYGPHLFHTDDEEVFSYLSQFTEWDIYQHRVLALIDGRKVPVPFNFTSMDILFPEALSKRVQEILLNHYEIGIRVPVLDLLNHQNEEVRFVARYVYEKVFLGYTIKQWGKRPEEIDPSVIARVPIVIGKDDRYFHDRYQCVPRYGYTELIRRMLDHPKIKLLLNTDFREIGRLQNGKVYVFDREFHGTLIYTGPIDELFDYCFGPLPYRSLKFDFEELEIPWFQEVATVNYPNDYNFTRITEFKHIHTVESKRTVILKEYPKDYEILKDVPCYPIFTTEARRSYEAYESLLRSFPLIIPLGRLAEYRYYDMDDAVARALRVFREKFHNA